MVFRETHRRPYHQHIESISEQKEILSKTKSLAEELQRRLTVIINESNTVGQKLVERLKDSENPTWIEVLNNVSRYDQVHDKIVRFFEHQVITVNEAASELDPTIATELYRELFQQFLLMKDTLVDVTKKIN